MLSNNGCLLVANAVVWTVAGLLYLICTVKYP